MYMYMYCCRVSGTCTSNTEYMIYKFILVMQDFFFFWGGVLPPSYPLWYTQPHARALYWVLPGQVMLCQFTPSTNCWKTERSPNIGRLSQGPWWKESPGQGSVHFASFSQPWYFLYLCPIGQQSPTDFCKLHFQYDRQFPESIGWERSCLWLHLSERIISNGRWYIYCT